MLCSGAGGGFLALMGSACFWYGLPTGRWPSEIDGKDLDEFLFNIAGTVVELQMWLL